MRRAWIVVPALAALTVAACGGATTTSGSARRSVSSTTVSNVLDLTPIAQAAESTSVSETSLGTLPDFSDDVPDSSAALPSSTAPVTIGATTLPSPAPPPLPNAFETKNQIGSIEIPALKVTAGLFEGVTLSTLNHGPGHWPGSAMPGQTGNVVVAGHRVSHTHPFRDLDRLQPGDQVIFSTMLGRAVYLVQKVQIVSPDALWIVQQTTGKTGTLFACHPKGSTLQRIVAFLTYAPDLSQPAA